MAPKSKETRKVGGLPKGRTEAAGSSKLIRNIETSYATETKHLLHRAARSKRTSEHNRRWQSQSGRVEGNIFVPRPLQPQHFLARVRAKGRLLPDETAMLRSIRRSSWAGFDAPKACEIFDRAHCRMSAIQQAAIREQFLSLRSLYIALRITPAAAAAAVAFVRKVRSEIRSEDVLPRPHSAFVRPGLSVRGRTVQDRAADGRLSHRSRSLPPPPPSTPPQPSPPRPPSIGMCFRGRQLPSSVDVTDQETSAKSERSGGGEAGMECGELAGAWYRDFLGRFARVAARSVEEGRKRLDLGGAGLARLPVEAGLLLSPNVAQLALSRNRLSLLPNDLSGWGQLQALRLDFNQLTTLPERFGADCESLVELNLTGNRLTGLPKSVSLLTVLTILLLSSNRLQALPTALAGCTALTRLAARDNQLQCVQVAGNLVRLRVLLLGQNVEMRHIAAELGQCRALETLELDQTVSFPPPHIRAAGVAAALGHLRLVLDARGTGVLNMSGLDLACVARPLCCEDRLTALDVSNNRLEFLPSALAGLTRLKRLVAAHNQIHAIPGVLGRLGRLEVFDVADNALAALPARLGRLTGLRELDVAVNRLRWLPLALRRLTALRRLGLSGNPLTDPPPDVVASGAVGVVRFLEAVHGLVSGKSTVQLQGAGLEILPLVFVHPLTRARARCLDGRPSHVFQSDGPNGAGWKLVSGVAGSDDVLDCSMEMHGGGMTGAENTDGEEYQDRCTGDSDDEVEQDNEENAAAWDCGRVMSLFLDANRLRCLPDVEHGYYYVPPAQPAPSKFIHLVPPIGVGKMGCNNGEGRCTVQRVGKGLGILRGLTALSLRDNMLTSVPGAIGCLTRLVRLTLDNNRIADWEDNPAHPATGLSRLTVLSLVDNRFSKIPEPVRGLYGLVRLAIDGNVLVRLPRWIGELGRMESLSAADNLLEELPAGLEGLSRVRELSVARNRLRILPDGLWRMTSLVRLRLSGNRLVELAQEVGRLKQLEELSISDNTLEIKAYLRRIFICGGGRGGLDLSKLDLEDLPSGAIAAGAAASVQHLSLRGNRLTSLPLVLGALEGLRSIDLRDNLFVLLPEVLLSLTGLGELLLEGNSLSSLPTEILAQPASVILDFTRRVRTARATASMSLAGLGLIGVPAAAMGAEMLIELVLDDNRLTRLPDALCWTMPSLTRLSVRRNQLTGALPIRIGLMTTLTALDVAQNRLRILPPGLALLTRLRTLSTASNPVRLPPAALVAQGLTALLAGLRVVVEARAGMLQTLLAGPIPGIASGTDLAPLARPSDSECVLVQGGRRAGLRLEEALVEAQEGSLILLRPGHCQVKGGPVCLRTAGITLAGDGFAEECIIDVAAGGPHRAAVLCTSSRQ